MVARHPNSTDMKLKPHHSQLVGFDTVLLANDKLALHWLVDFEKGNHIDSTDFVSQLEITPSIYQRAHHGPSLLS